MVNIRQQKMKEEEIIKMKIGYAEELLKLVNNDELYVCIREALTNVEQEFHDLQQRKKRIS